MPASPIRRRSPNTIYDPSLEEADPNFVLSPGGQAPILEDGEADTGAGLVPESVVASDLMGELLSQIKTGTTSISKTSSSDSRRERTSSSHATSHTHSSLASSETSASISDSVSNLSSSASLSSQTTAMSSTSSFASQTPSASISPTSSLSTQMSATAPAAISQSSMPDTTSLSSASPSATQTDHAIVYPTDTPYMHRSYTHSPIFAVAIVLGVLIAIAFICAIGRYVFKIRQSRKEKKEALETAAALYGTGEMYQGQRVDDYMNTIGSEMGNNPEFVSRSRNVSASFLPAALVSRSPSFSSTIPLAFTGIGGGGVDDLAPSAPYSNAVPGAPFPMRDGSYPTVHPLPSRPNMGANVFEDIHGLGSLQSQIASIARGDVADPSRTPARRSMARVGAPMGRRQSADSGFLGLHAGGMTFPWISSQVPPEFAGAVYPNPREGARAAPGAPPQIPAEPRRTNYLSEDDAQMASDWLSLPTLGRSLSRNASSRHLGSLRTSTSLSAGNSANPFRSLSEEDILLEPPQLELTFGRRPSKQDEPEREEDIGIGGALEAGIFDTGLLRPWALEESCRLSDGVYGRQGHPVLDTSRSTLGLDNDNLRSADFMRVASHESQIPLIPRQRSSAPAQRSQLGRETSEASASSSDGGYCAQKARPPIPKLPALPRPDLKTTKEALAARLRTRPSDMVRLLSSES